MSAATVRHTRVEGFDAIVLENDRVRAVVLPSLGGRIWELADRIRGRQWIWHRTDVRLSAAAPGAAYDDVWAGGWEELFPNDAPGEFEGRALPDHGIWWTTPWQTTDTSVAAEARVRLTAETHSPHVSSVKEIRLADDADTLRVSYQITSHEEQPFHFLFKQHLPLALTPSCTLAMPGGIVSAVDPAFGSLLRTRIPFAWPAMQRDDGRIVDLSVVPEQASGEREFVYVSDLPDGWCGVDDPACGASLRMQFDSRAVPFAWLFLTYGGWRDCYTAVLEPCTNMPKDLAEALRTGRSARLSAGGVFTTEVAVTLAALVNAGSTA